jgi:hypothetical protein
MILLQTIFTFLLSCSGNGNSGSVDGNKNEIQQPGKEVDVLIKKWQSDSLGCQKLRTKQVSETIIDSLKLQGTAQAGFIKVFGNPNTENERDGSKILGYYFDGICRDGKFIDSADYCIAEFTFKANRLISRNYICQ